jgi:hypothetical protein
MIPSPQKQTASILQFQHITSHHILTMPPKYQSFLLLAWLAVTATGQQYDGDQDYPEYPEYQDYAASNSGADNLYADYAAHQQDKQVGGGYVSV